MSDQALQELAAKNAELEKKIAELSKPNGDASGRLAYLEEEHKKLIEARDKAKEEKRIAEEKRLAEAGEFKTIAEQRAAEIDKLSKNSEALAEKLAEYQKRDEMELQELTAKIPEEYKDEMKDASISLEARLRLARKLSAQKAPPAGFRPPGEPPPEGLRAKYDAAVKSGDIMAQISLKRQMAEANQT